MTVRWTAEAENPGSPAGWAKHDGVFYCLACRRERAGEAGVAGFEDAPAADRQKRTAAARLEFELGRDPARADNKIAKACRTSIPAVQKARKRLGMDAHRPG